MNTHRLTGSRTDLAEAGCMYWARPDVAVPADTMGPAADQGVRLHALAEGLATGHLPDAASIAPDIEDRYQQLAPWIAQWVDATTGAVRLVEAAFKIDVNTGRVLGIPRNAGRDYGHTMTEVPARLDLGAIYEDRVEVWDLKTGETAPRASEAGQLRTIALMLCSAFSRPRAVVHIVHVRDTCVRVDSAELEQWDLDAHADMLRKAVRSLPVAQPVPGSHCRWCDARTVCPAIVSAMVAAPSLAISTPEDVARVWPLLKPIEDCLAAIKARVREEVEVSTEPITLENGHHLRVVRAGGGETVDLKALAQAVGEDAMARLRASGVVKPRAQGSYVKEVNAR